MNKKWLIVGAGYSGSWLAQKLASAGHRVCITKRTDAQAHADSLGQGITGLNVDVANNYSALTEPASGAVVVYSVPPIETSPATERNVARAISKCRKAIYWSSTSMYPRTDGDWVDENATPELSSTRAANRYHAEQAFLAQSDNLPFTAVALRLVGIYGPGRGVVERMKAGNYRLIGGGKTFVNRIHVDDIASATIAAAQTTTTSKIYNIADDSPAPSYDFAKDVSELLDLPMPPSKDKDDVTPRVWNMLTANRRVSNARAKKELGWQPRYASYRDALPELCQS